MEHFSNGGCFKSSRKTVSGEMALILLDMSRHTSVPHDLLGDTTYSNRFDGQC
jgi:hypothetical protein